MTFGSMALAPALKSLLGSQSVYELGLLSRPEFISARPGTTTDAATTTTTSPAAGLEVGALVAAASPFLAPPPAPPPVPLAVPQPPAVAPAVAAPPGPQLPPTSDKASRRRSQKGEASWYQIHNGTCAHKTLPKGTLVRVVNVANKREIICRVADRGPFLDGRIIDLDLEGFKLLADRSEGVIDVRINW